MKFAIKRPKEVEIDQLMAACWYDAHQPGLGDNFLDETEAVIASLADNALLYSVRFTDVRCARLKRFKRYGVYCIISCVSGKYLFLPFIMELVIRAG